jgi:hypothetical protein
MMIQLYGRGINSFAELQQEDVKARSQKNDRAFLFNKT